MDTPDLLVAQKQARIKVVEDAAANLIDAIYNTSGVFGTTPEADIAKLKVYEAIMWASRGITQ